MLPRQLTPFMGHRLSKIVTRTGDAGTTGLGDGTRVDKDSARIAAIGDVDELNSTLGLLLTEALPAPIAACLTSTQHRRIWPGPRYLQSLDRGLRRKHHADEQSGRRHNHDRLPPFQTLTRDNLNLSSVGTTLDSASIKVVFTIL